MFRTWYFQTFSLSGDTNTICMHSTAHKTPTRGEKKARTPEIDKKTRKVVCCCLSVSFFFFKKKNSILLLSLWLKSSWFYVFRKRKAELLWNAIVLNKILSFDWIFSFLLTVIQLHSFIFVRNGNWYDLFDLCFKLILFAIIC